MLPICVCLCVYVYVCVRGFVCVDKMYLHCICTAYLCRFLATGLGFLLQKRL